MTDVWPTDVAWEGPEPKEDAINDPAHQEPGDLPPPAEGNEDEEGEEE